LISIGIHGSPSATSRLFKDTQPEALFHHDLEYEIRQVDAEEILFIGSSAKLTRLYDMLFRSSTRDSSLSASLREDVENASSRLAIRWAEIAEWYRLAVEYQLLQQYLQRFGRLPKYVRH
jgi:hypothetical protein